MQATGRQIILSNKLVKIIVAEEFKRPESEDVYMRPVENVLFAAHRSTFLTVKLISDAKLPDDFAIREAG